MRPVEQWWTPYVWFNSLTQSLHIPIGHSTKFLSHHNWKNLWRFDYFQGIYISQCLLRLLSLGHVSSTDTRDWTHVESCILLEPHILAALYEDGSSPQCPKILWPGHKGQSRDWATRSEELHSWYYWGSLHWQHWSQSKTLAEVGVGSSGHQPEPRGSWQPTARILPSAIVRECKRFSRAGCPGGWLTVIVLALSLLKMSCDYHSHFFLLVGQFVLGHLPIQRKNGTNLRFLARSQIGSVSPIGKMHPNPLATVIRESGPLHCCIKGSFHISLTSGLGFNWPQCFWNLASVVPVEYLSIKGLRWLAWVKVRWDLSTLKGVPFDTYYWGSSKSFFTKYCEDLG